MLYTTIRGVKAYALFKAFSGDTKSVAKTSVGPVGRVIWCRHRDGELRNIETHYGADARP